MAAAAGYAADTASLLAGFVSQHRDSARFDEFKHVWRTKCFSLIHMARPQALTDEQFTQALYAAAIALLGGSAGAATSQGVDANDAGVLYALLLLFRTQHCVPRVPVYVHLDKVKSLLSLHRQAVDAKHEDVLRVFRVLLAEDALVLGSVAQPAAAAAAPRLTATASRHPCADAAEQHLLTAVENDFACDALASLSAQYAAAAGPCGLEHSAAQLQHALHACLDTLASNRQALAPGASPWSADTLPADTVPGAVGPTAGAMASRSAVLPLQRADRRAQQQFDAQLAALAAAGERDEETIDMPFIPGV